MKTELKIDGMAAVNHSTGELWTLGLSLAGNGAFLIVLPVTSGPVAVGDVLDVPASLVGVSENGTSWPSRVTVTAVREKSKQVDGKKEIRVYSCNAMAL